MSALGKKATWNWAVVGSALEKKSHTELDWCGLSRVGFLGKFQLKIWTGVGLIKMGF